MLLHHSQMLVRNQHGLAGVILHVMQHLELPVLGPMQYHLGMVVQVLPLLGLLLLWLQHRVHQLLPLGLLVQLDAPVASQAVAGQQWRRISGRQLARKQQAQKPSLLLADLSAVAQPSRPQRCLVA